MSFFRFLRFRQEPPNPSSIHERIFATGPPKLFTQPVPGRIEICSGHSPRVRVAGSSYPLRWHGCIPKTVPANGEEVSVVGYMGICLLVTLTSVQSNAATIEASSWSTS